jgi:predicted O-methyltransferase YrrM
MRENNLLSMTEEQICAQIKSHENLVATKQLAGIFESDTIFGPEVMGLLEAGKPETRAVVTYFARLLVPASFLEVGTRRGWSTCAVGLASPECDIYCFDGWHVDYAGVPNPGPDFVQGELAKFGVSKPINFVNGDSHETLRAFFTENPDKMMEMNLIDGDHSELGALQDLRDTMSHVAVGGVMLFDDIVDIPPLNAIWQHLRNEFPNFKYYAFTENRPGVGFAIRTQ